jgi:hypothetical protein
MYVWWISLHGCLETLLPLVSDMRRRHKGMKKWQELHPSLPKKRIGD